MTDEGDTGAALPPEEHSLAEWLVDQRPVPTAGFRGTLGRHIAAIDPGYGPRPERLRVIVSAYLTVGTLLIAVGALQAAGVV
jgi:hypothetical protein